MTTKRGASPFRRALAGATAGLGLFSLAACQLGPIGVPSLHPVAAPTAIVQSDRSAAVSQADAPASAREVAWGRIPRQCMCHQEGPAMVVDALDRAGLTATFAIVASREGWQYFSVTFDSRQAARAQVEAAIRDGGGTVLATAPGETDDP